MKAITISTEGLDLSDIIQIENLAVRLRNERNQDAVKAAIESDAGLDEIYEILGRRHFSGERDLAERHNEHQP